MLSAAFLSQKEMHLYVGDLLYSKTDFILVHFYTHIDNLIESTNELLSSY